jgi:hypothetical protein
MGICIVGCSKGHTMGICSTGVVSIVHTLMLDTVFHFKFNYQF